jgi:hypothetical protein
MPRGARQWADFSRLNRTPPVPPVTDRLKDPNAEIADLEGHIEG